MDEDLNYTYYYGLFSIFEETIVLDLLWTQSFMKNLDKELGSYWHYQCGQVAYQLQENRKQYLSGEFIKDTLIYCWVFLRKKTMEINQTNQVLFESEVLRKLKGQSLGRHHLKLNDFQTTKSFVRRLKNSSHLQ